MPTTVRNTPRTPIWAPVCSTKGHGVTRRSSTRLDATTSNDIQTSHCGERAILPRDPSRPLPCQGLAEKPLRPEHENQNQHGERYEIAQLIGCSDADTVEKQGRADRLDHAQEESARHGSRNIADSAQHSGAERLDARQETREEINLFVDEAVEHAANARHAGAEHEGEDDHLIRIN